jgi:hypothetical protein
MSAGQAPFKETLSDGFFVPVASLIGQVYARTEPTGNTGVLGGSFSTASWAFWGSRATSSINGAGAGLLRDMGKTVVSSLRTFRKVQLVVPTGSGASNTSVSSFGVGGAAGTIPSQDYYTGYIELGFEGVGTPAPVAHYGR